MVLVLIDSNCVGRLDQQDVLRLNNLPDAATALWSLMCILQGRWEGSHQGQTWHRMSLAANTCTLRHCIDDKKPVFTGQSVTFGFMCWFGTLLSLHTLSFPTEYLFGILGMQKEREMCAGKGGGEFFCASRNH